MAANVNPKTNIRYGVVSLNSLQDWVYDEFFDHGTNQTSKAALEDFHTENPDATDDDEQSFWDDYQTEEEEYTLEVDGMSLALSYLGGAPLVWIFESPVTTRARLCSPCVPGAGDLDSLDEQGEECYTLPADWFSNDV